MKRSGEDTRGGGQQDWEDMLENSCDEIFKECHEGKVSDDSRNPSQMKLTYRTVHRTDSHLACVFVTAQGSALSIWWDFDI